MMISREMFITGLFGLAAGSFLNVCIYRLPRGESIIWPGSYCPQCRHGLSWLENIPLFSFLMFRGHCRWCQNKISVRYPAVEILSAFIWAASWNLNSDFLSFTVSVVFLSLLLAAFFTDLETGLIPDSITFPGIVTGFALSFFYPPLHGTVANGRAFYSSLSGLCAGALLGCIAGWAGKVIFKKDAFGEGDIKFLAMLGAFLGWQSVTLTFFLAPFLAAPFALYVRWVKKLEVIPYGPFLSLAAALYFLIWQVF